MKNAIPYLDEDFIEALYMAVHKSKQFTKACAKWKRKPAASRATEAQAREYFKSVYEIFDLERDSFHEMGVANNVVMQEKLDSLAAENAMIRQEMAADQTSAKQYHQVIERAMSMTHTTHVSTVRHLLRNAHIHSHQPSSPLLWYCTRHQRH